MNAPIRIQTVRTLWAHWGGHAGIVRYLDYLPADAFTVDDYATPFSKEPMGRARHNLGRFIKRHVFRSSMPWYTDLDLRAEIAVSRRAVARGADVLHFLDPEHGMQFIPLVARHVPGRWKPRLVATFHQPPERLHETLRKDVVRAIDFVTLVSPVQLEYFEGWFPVDRISVILHGIDTGFFRPAEAAAQRPSWTCLTVGQYLRDFEALRLVAERLRNEAGVRFHVVAPDETGLEGMPNVKIYRGLSDQELLSMYQQADVLLLPLQNSTANNALLEGFACGLPAVTTDLPATRAYAPGGEAILVPNNEVEALVEAVMGLRSDQRLCARLRASARQRAEQLSWENIAPSYAQVYREVTGR